MNDPETAQKRLDKTIKNTPACSQPFIHGRLATEEGVMANPHGADEQTGNARELVPARPGRIRNIYLKIPENMLTEIP
jgi:hypothetical protein